MVLDKIPNTQLFTQRDVRETPASISSATSGTVQADYVTLSVDADLDNERTLAVNTDDLALNDAGAGNAVTISLKNKTSYLSIPGLAFQSEHPDVDDAQYNFLVGSIFSSASTVSFGCPVNLPHGAIVTGCIVYELNATDKTWNLRREEVNGGNAGEIMATANLGTEDSTITGATIDNSTYRYFINCADLEPNDTILGALITYTTDYI